MQGNKKIIINQKVKCWQITETESLNEIITKDRIKVSLTMKTELFWLLTLLKVVQETFLKAIL